MTGDPTNVDPACGLSPRHAEFLALASIESVDANPPPFVYRRIGTQTSDNESFGELNAD